MYGFDLWIKIAHLLFYLYSSGQFWQLKFSFIDQCSHCAHEGTGAHSLLHSRNDDFWFHDWVKLGITTDITISSKSHRPRQEACCKTQSPFKEGRRRILAGSLQGRFNAAGTGHGYIYPSKLWCTVRNLSLVTQSHRLKNNEQKCLKKQNKC
jgi:hypothetical protein